jgi:transcriptional regulator with XRE-family HTH domain
MPANNLGDFIRRRRKERGCSLEEVAQAIHITRGFLSEIERGSRNPSTELLGKLASVLGVDRDQLEDLDSWAALGDFRQMIESDRKLSLAFTRAIRRIKQEEQPLRDLTKCFERISDAKPASKP